MLVMGWLATLFTSLTNPCARNRFRIALTGKNIKCRIHLLPLSLDLRERLVCLLNHGVKVFPVR